MSIHVLSIHSETFARQRRLQISYEITVYILFFLLRFIRQLIYFNLSPSNFSFFFLQPLLFTLCQSNTVFLSCLLYCYVTWLISFFFSRLISSVDYILVFSLMHVFDVESLRVIPIITMSIYFCLFLSIF